LPRKQPGFCKKVSLPIFDTRERSPVNRLIIKISLLLIVALVLFLYPLQGYCHNNIRIYVNGERKDINPYMKDGIVYLPAVSMSMALGTRIKWDPDRRLVTVNDVAVSASPVEVEGVLFLPVEIIATSSGARVEWDGPQNAIRIFKSDSRPTQTQKAALQPRESPLPLDTPDPVPAKSYAVSIPAFSLPEPGISGSPAPTGTSRQPGSYSPGTVPSAPPGVYTYPLMDPSRYVLSSLPPGRKSSFAQFPSAPPVSASAIAPSFPPGKTEIPEVSPSAGNFNSIGEEEPGFFSRTGSNGVFSVTVTKMNYITEIKSFYRPRQGFKFVMVYLSQKNISSATQVYTGTFSLVDHQNITYKHIESLSNFWVVILRPGGVNSGYLVFEVPIDARPSKIMLEGLEQSNLSVVLM
jgi:hypothetical protein